MRTCASGSPRLLPMPTATTTGLVTAFAGLRAAPAATAPATPRRRVIHHMLTLRLRALIKFTPPLGQVGRSVAYLGTQEEKIIGGTEARMRDHAQSAPPIAALEALLQGPDFPHRHTEALGNGHGL